MHPKPDVPQTPIVDAKLFRAYKIVNDLHWVTSFFINTSMGTVVYFESIPHTLSCSLVLEQASEKLPSRIVHLLVC